MIVEFGSLIHLQLLILVSDLFPHIDYQITRRFHIFVEVVRHHILHAAKLALLAHVEMAHNDHVHVAAAHQVHEGVLLVKRQVGRRRGGIIVRGTEQPIVTDDKAMAVVVAV